MTHRGARRASLLAVNHARPMATILMHPSKLIPCLCFAAASLSAQNFVEIPATASPSFELNAYSLPPLTRADARVMVFYDQAEVPGSPFTATEIAMRYDGPIPQVGLPGPFQITRLQIRIGVSSVPTPGADFAANLTQPLTTVLDGPWTYLPDDGSASPHPWGGPGGTLTFPFTAPVPITINAGQWLVVEIVVEGNDLPVLGFAHPMLDGASTTGGFTNGTTVSYGQGCAASPTAANATASVTGLYGPGGVHFLTGQDLGANAPVLGVFGLTNPTFPLTGTSCSLLVSPDLTVLTFADAAGAVGGASAIALPLPANPAFSGVQLFEQLVSLVPAANPWSLVTSDAVDVTLGTWTAPGRGTLLMVNDTDANAPYANSIRAFGYGMRLRTL